MNFPFKPLRSLSFGTTSVWRRLKTFDIVQPESTRFARSALLIMRLAASAFGVAAVTSSTAAAGAATAPAPPLVLTVQASAVRVANVAPHGDVVLLSVAKRTRGGQNYLETKTRMLRDTDNAGFVSLDAPVPLRSVWVAVDVSTGRVVAGAPADFPFMLGQIAPSLFRKDADGEIAALEQQLPRVILLCVRPGQGAWTQQGRDGAAGDRDAVADGRVVLAFEDARPVGDSKEKAPRKLKAGDVIVAVEPGRLDVFVSEVSK